MRLDLKTYIQNCFLCTRDLRALTTAEVYAQREAWWMLLDHAKTLIDNKGLDKEAAQKALMVIFIIVSRR